MRLSLDPSEVESLRETGGIEPRFISFFRRLDDHHRLIVVETDKGFHWAIMGPTGCDRLSVHPAPLVILAIMAGQQEAREFLQDVLEVLA